MKQKEQALHIMKEKNIDVMILTAGENLRYITNNKLSESERLLLYFLLQDGTGIYIVPEVEKTKVDLSNTDTILSYKDEDTHTHLLEQLKEKLYTFRNVAVEFTKMRLFEFYFVQKLFEGDFIDVEEVIGVLRKYKNTEEIKYIQSAVNILEESLEATLPYIEIGRKEIEIAAKLECEMRLRQSEGTPFSTIVASGYRGALPHGRASEKKIEDGDFIVIDFGSIYKGYVGDMTRTVGIGNVTEKQKQTYKVVQKALQESIGEIAIGKKVAEIDRIARNTINQAGYGKYFTHRLGHGIGLNPHESPYISQTDCNVFQEGMTFTIEPGIYVESEFGIRIEDNIVITKNGARNMMDMTHELILL